MERECLDLRAAIREKGSISKEELRSIPVFPPDKNFEGCIEELKRLKSAFEDPNGIIHYIRHQNLLVTALGNRNSGKSHTWNLLFRLFDQNRPDSVRTGVHLRRLKVSENECVEVFLISGSPQEKNKYVEELLNGNHPRIILCSMQYMLGEHGVLGTIDYFVEREYFLYVHWLNPGYSDPNGPYPDDLGIIRHIARNPSQVEILNGKENADGRVRVMINFIREWASARNLIVTC